MARTGTGGGKVSVGGATAKALTAGVGTVALVSMVKFLRLLKMSYRTGTIE